MSNPLRAVCLLLACTVLIPEEVKAQAAVYVCLDKSGSIKFKTKCTKKEKTYLPNAFFSSLGISTQGPTGQSGPQGQEGVQGANGSKGEKGDKGDTGPTGPIGPKGENGSQGPAGPKGERGQPAYSIYGDGSGGELVLNSSEDWTIAPTPHARNLQFENCTIGAGVTLKVPSGTTIRCLNSFTNNGTIAVGYGAHGGYRKDNPVLVIPPEPGISKFVYRDYPHDDYPNVITQGMSGGVGLTELEARQILSGRHGGGGGGIGDATPNEALSMDMFGNAGGGIIRIFAGSLLTNNGAIVGKGQESPCSLANVGEAGCGGGGGGVVILVSDGTISNSGSINVEGGKGQSYVDYDSNRGGPGGGGGGGGIIHLISTNADSIGGTLSVSGGKGGAAKSGPFFYIIPGFGGASGGNGGATGKTPCTIQQIISSQCETFFAGQDGNPGYVLRTKVISAASLFY